jgi:hypothetical protein
LVWLVIETYRLKIAGAGLLARLFRWCDFFDRPSFNVGLIALHVGLVQKVVDNTSALLLLDPSLLRL